MNPRLAIVAYPILSVKDRAIVQVVRAEHDPQFVLLDPHFTLVFPVEASMLRRFAYPSLAGDAREPKSSRPATS